MAHNQLPAADQFLLVEEAAASLNLNSRVLRQGIACGLVPIRRDNTGTIRIHLGEVPDALQEKIANADVQPELHSAALADEVLSLENHLSESVAQRARLEELIAKQAAVLTRVAAQIDSRTRDAEAPTDSLVTLTNKLAEREAEVENLSSILDRTFQAIKIRDRQVAEQSDQFTRTTEKAMQLLQRSVRQCEMSSQQLNMLNQQISISDKNSVRLEHELDQRNTVITNQTALMERMVTIAEQNAVGASSHKPRKRSFWQRLWGGGKGI